MDKPEIRQCGAVWVVTCLELIPDSAIPDRHAAAPERALVTEGV